MSFVAFACAAAAGGGRGAASSIAAAPRPQLRPASSGPLKRFYVVGWQRASRPLPVRRLSVYWDTWARVRPHTQCAAGPLRYFGCNTLEEAVERIQADANLRAMLPASTNAPPATWPAGAAGVALVSLSTTTPRGEEAMVRATAATAPRHSVKPVDCWSSSDDDTESSPKQQVSMVTVTGVLPPPPPLSPLPSPPRSRRRHGTKRSRSRSRSRSSSGAAAETAAAAAAAVATRAEETLPQTRLLPVKGRTLLIVATDGSVGSRNGCPDAAGGIGVALRWIAIDDNRVLLERVWSEPMVWNDGGTHLVPPHTNPRAEWHGVARGVELALGVLCAADSPRVEAPPHVLFACDYQAVETCMQKRCGDSTTKPLFDARRDTNAGLKTRVGALWCGPLRRAAASTRLVWVRGHVPPAKYANLPPHKRALFELNAQADTAAKAAAALYDRMYSTSS